MKEYNIEEIFETLDEPVQINMSEAKNHIDKFPKHSYECLVLRNFDNNDTGEMELLLSRCEILDIKKSNSNYIVSYRVGKYPYEKLNKMDVFTDVFQSKFESDSIPFFKYPNFLVELKAIAGVPLFLQETDGKIVQKKKIHLISFK